MAAGKGVRLWPLTEKRSKHMIPLAGRPVIEHVISAIKSSGIRSLVLVTSYQEELIREYMGDGGKWGVKIEYAHQADVSGTGSAVLATRQYVEDNDFLAVYGDVVVNPAAIKRVVKVYRKSGQKPTLGLAPVTRPQSFGMARISGKWLTEIVEKPEPASSPTDLANTGIYVLKPGIFDYLDATTQSVRGEFELTDAISSLARSGTAIAWARIDPSEWQDIGRPWDILSSNANMLARIRRSISGSVGRGVTLVGRVAVQRGAVLKTGTVIEGPAWIGKDSVLGPFAHIRSGTSIGKGAVIGNFCEIKNSIIMDRTRIEHLSYVGDSIIGEGCNLGAGTIVANLKFSNRTVRMKIRDRFEDTGLRKLGVFTGDSVKTGVNSTIMPGVRIASGAVVAAGSLVSQDILPA